MLLIFPFFVWCIFKCRLLVFTLFLVFILFIGIILMSDLMIILIYSLICKGTVNAVFKNLP